MNWKPWLQGLAAAAIGGAAGGGLQALQNGGGFDEKTGIAAGVGALGMVLAYLAKSPIGQEPKAPEVPKQ